MTAIVEFSVRGGWSRMSLPYILGTMVTADRRKAPLIGAALHTLNGLIFAMAYAVVFESLGRATIWSGIMLGFVHSLFMLMTAPLLAAVHPRMATDQDGPAARAALQPPGFLILNYGPRTPLIALASHILYGAVLGAFYTVT